MQENTYIKHNISNFSAINEGDIHGNSYGDEVTDEQCLRISNATLPYLEQLHKLLLDPPYVNIAHVAFCII